MPIDVFYTKQSFDRLLKNGEKQFGEGFFDGRGKIDQFFHLFVFQKDSFDVERRDGVFDESAASSKGVENEIPWSLMAHSKQ